MYLILIIYSIANLNVVSWGTREVAEKKTKKQMKLEEEEKLKKQPQENKKSNRFKMKSWITCGLGDYLRNMIKIIVPQKSNENVTSSKIDEIEAQKINDDDKQIEIFNEDNNADDTISLESVDEKIDDENNPYWTRDPKIGQDKKSCLRFLSQTETNFWKNCIAQYLEPIDNDKQKQVQTWTIHGIGEGRGESPSLYELCFYMKN